LNLDLPFDILACTHNHRRTIAMTSPTASIRTRRPRSKTGSSLKGMMLDESSNSSSEFCLPKIFETEHHHSPVDDNAMMNKMPVRDRESLLEMSRGLRRAKRRLFLAATSQPTEPVDQLRELLRQISVDCMDNFSSDDEMSLSRLRSNSFQ
jgi:hypothetical protein